MEADHVILACPAWAAAELLAPVDPQLAAQLGEIEYSSSLTLSLIYRASEFDGVRPASVPGSEEGTPSGWQACTFCGSKFSHRVPDDRIACDASSRNQR